MPLKKFVRFPEKLFSTASATNFLLRLNKLIFFLLSPTALAYNRAPPALDYPCVHYARRVIPGGFPMIRSSIVIAAGLAFATMLPAISATLPRAIAFVSTATTPIRTSARRARRSERRQRRGARRRTTPIDSAGFGRSPWSRGNHHQPEQRRRGRHRRGRRRRCLLMQELATPSSCAEPTLPRRRRPGVPVSYLTPA